MKMINLMTKENQEKVVILNKIAQSNNIQILEKTNALISEGFLKVVEPKNATQKSFLNDNEVIVELSKKGKELVLKALV